MKNITEYNHLIEKEMEKYMQNTQKILGELESQFNKGSIVAIHHFINASPELIALVKSELEKAGFRPELLGNKPGHVVLRVSLLRSSELADCK